VLLKLAHSVADTTADSAVAPPHLQQQQHTSLSLAARNVPLLAPATPASGRLLPPLPPQVGAQETIGAALGERQQQQQQQQQQPRQQQQQQQQRRPRQERPLQQQPESHVAAVMAEAGHTPLAVRPTVVAGVGLAAPSTRTSDAVPFQVVPWLSSRSSSLL
jgi:hypothetical protein